MAEQQGSTKVYYHLDDSTPYMSEVPVPLGKITLADFKRVFTRKGYTYFCKEWDAHLKREVKVEIGSDRQLLHKSANGLIELFLLSQNAAPCNSDTLPRAKWGARAKGIIPCPDQRPPTLKGDRQLPHHNSALALSSLASSELLDLGGGQRVSMATDGGCSSDALTLMSKRAGERLAELYNSTSEDPYNRTSISSFRQPGPLPSLYTENEESITAAEQTDWSLAGRDRKRRAGHRQRSRRKPYVPSTISSASESSYSLPRIEEVKLHLGNRPLGIGVACKDGSIFIYNINPGSAAEFCGQLEIGDQIVQVDDTRFEELSEKQALELLKRINGVKSRTITVYVAKRAHAINGESSAEEQRSDGLSQLAETMQLDISQWVESTKFRRNGVEQHRPFVDVPPVESDLGGAAGRGAIPLLAPLAGHPLLAAESSDEERAAYLDRRNGVGARLVPAVQLQQTRQQKAAEERRKTAASAANGVSNEMDNNTVLPSASQSVPPKVQQPLHAAMDPLVILRRMVEPNSGLAIRDRKWLKIPVPMSFIGHEMVDWLLVNVQGFQERKRAKTFASRLLTRGLIKHVVNINSFSEKCYYIFDESIIGQRRLSEKEDTGISQHQQMANGNGTGISRVQPLQPASAQGHQLPPESNTEITYMSSPSSPFFATAGHPPPLLLQQQQQIGGGPPQLVIANNPVLYAAGPSALNKPGQPDFTSGGLAQRATANNNSIPLRSLNPPKPVHSSRLPPWPISPIPIARRCQPHQPPQIDISTMREEECPGSPEATNDYASMIQGEINCGAQFDQQFDFNGGMSTLQQRQQPKENAGHPNSVGTANNSPHFGNNNLSQPNALALPPVLLPAPPLPQRQPMSNK